MLAKMTSNNLSPFNTDFILKSSCYFHSHYISILGAVVEVVAWWVGGFNCPDQSTAIGYTFRPNLQLDSSLAFILFLLYTNTLPISCHCNCHASSAHCAIRRLCPLSSPPSTSQNLQSWANKWSKQLWKKYWSDLSKIWNLHVHLKM